MRRDKRQSSLNFQYHFVCSCEACVNDYGLFHELRPGRIPALSTDEGFVKLSAFDRKFALKNYPTYCSYLKKYIDFYPCHEYSEIQEYLKLAVCIINETFTFKLVCSKAAEK